MPSIGLPRDYWLLLTSLFLVNMFGLGFSPFLIYFLRGVGAEAFEAAYVLAISRTLYTLLLPLGGLASDVAGRRLPLILGPVIIGASYIALAGADSWTETILPLTISFIPVAFTTPSVYAYLADVVAPDRYGRAFGIYSSAMNISAVLGFLAVGYLIEALGYRAALLAVGASSLLAAVFRLLLREPYRGVGMTSISVSFRDAWSLLRSKVISLLVLTRGVYLALEITMFSVIIPLWASNVALLPEWQLSIAYSVEAAVYSLLAPIGGRLIEGGTRWLRLSTLELLLKVPAILILASSPGFSHIATALILNSGLAVFLLPSLDSMFSESSGRAHRGILWGIQQSITSALTIALTFLGGYVWGAIGAVNTVLVFLSYPVLTLCMVLSVARLYRRDN